MTNSKNENISRPPVIAIMGHIDHGKSALLDYIRKSNVVASESGGITQHISAYEVTRQGANDQKHKITFLDTPGHAAFEMMRTRGATICDIAILIVSAEEGVKAQTLEALQSIQNAGKPFIVAINKIDKPNANIERTKQSLAENNILVEGWGGSIPCAAISAKTGDGIEELLDLMLLVAEMEQLTGNPNQPAEGYVLESNLDQRSGVTVSVIIKNGTLNTGDFILVGNNLAKIKKLENYLGQTQKSLSFSAPAKIFGFAKLPAVGEKFNSGEDKKEMEERANLFQSNISGKLSFSLSVDSDGPQTIIPLIIKADVDGTKEAVLKEIAKLKHDRVYLKIIEAGVGNISENDIKLSGANSDSIIIGFRVKADRSAIDLAEKQGLPIFTSDIIYKLSEWLEEQMLARAPKITIEETIGQAKILKTFNRNKDKQVIGGTVTVGKIFKNRPVKIIRRESEIGRGKIIDLQQQKIKTNEVDLGNQFGAEVDARVEIMPGDILEVFDTVTK